MPFEWFVALRYLRDAKGQTALILAAVSVGVSVIVFLSALINGLQVSLIDKTLGSQPHITLQVQREAARPLVDPSNDLAVARSVQPAPQRLRSIDQWPLVMADAERTAGVVAASAAIVGAGFAVRAEAKNAIVVRGVDPERFLAIIDVRKRMRAGRFDVAGGDAVIGVVLANELGVGVGDKIRITTTEGIDDVVAITGVFSLGNEAVDKTWVITSLRRAQTLYALPGGATSIELKVADVFAAEAVAGELRGRTGLKADSWMKINAELLTGLSAQSSSKSMIQFFVVLAVALGIASVLIVSVVQKSREIGILRAVGTPRGRVLRIFLIQGAVLGLLGSFVGSALGALLSKLFEGLVRGPDGAPKFPVQLDLELFVLATALAVGVGLLAAVLPARRASRLDPALAIRNG
ncbi:ABC transporter permease [Sorangium atrum]|uniref:ABC transporter permease n=1 Tax=Sorangium atrum TaxID=2995308 RepID=A0ABT5C9K4_9BACT|nr:ABC transporter permease [Sorangium aterium]MDC0682638.1 ABC transporter permease [Sorangium aterium]